MDFLRSDTGVPQVIFEGLVEVDDSATTEHFESIQSTNWQTVRWKPPPMKANACSPHVGWRTESLSCQKIAKKLDPVWRSLPSATQKGYPSCVEPRFRSMEVQMTDFENAAFTAFIVIVPG